MSSSAELFDFREPLKATAAEASKFRWFDKCEITQSKGLDLDSLMAEFAHEEGFEEDLKEAYRELGNNVLGESQSLAALRLRAGLSQKALALEIESTQPYVARLEAGKVSEPGIKTCSKIAKALGVTLDEVARIFAGEEQ